MARLVSAVTAARLWLTNSTVRPGIGDLRHAVEAARLELGVADRQHLVDHQDLGLEMRRHREGEPDIHADRVALDRRVEELLDAGEGDDLVEAVAASRPGVMPRMAPFRKMFSRPVSSGWKPVPTSSRLATRPLIATPAPRSAR